MRIVNLLVLWISFILFLAPLNAQSYINRSHSLGYLATVFTGIHSTDSCLYIKGVMTDSLYRSGSFFLKASLNGDILEKTEFVETQKIIDSWSNDLIQNIAGNFLLLGYQLQVEEPTFTAFLKEISPSGETLREQHVTSPFYPSDKFIITSGVVQNDDGSYFVSGNLGNTNNNKAVYFLAIIDSSFGQVKTNTYTGPDSEGAYSSAYDKYTGNILIGGWEFTIGFVPNKASRKRITKIDATTGSVLWNWVYPPGLPVERAAPVMDMLPLPDGSIIGASSVSITRPVGDYEEFFYYPTIFKLNADRSLAWERRMGNGRYYLEESWMQAVLPANDGGGYIGAAAVNFRDTLQTGENTVGIIAKVSEQGDSLWARYIYQPFPLLRLHRVYDIQPSANKDGYYIAGTNFVPINNEGQVQQQGWLVRVDNYGCLSPGCHLQVYSPEAPLEDNIHLYPNPTSAYVVIDHGGHDFSKGLFRIHDAQGRVLSEWRAPQGELSTLVSVAQYPAGQYWLWYEGPGGERVRKGFEKQ